MLTSGSLAALQEVLASWIAKDVGKRGHYFSSRVPKMAAYGALISAPMGHVLIKALQWLFAGRTSLKAKILQILVSNLVVCRFPLLAPVSENFVTDAKENPDLTNPKYYISCIYGSHCRSTYISSSSSYCTLRFHASHESQLDHVSIGIGLCTEIPTWTDLGSILQYYCICYWNIYQCTY